MRPLRCEDSRDLRVSRGAPWLPSWRGCCALIGACKSEHLIISIDEFPKNCRAYETGGAGYENTHVSSYVVANSVDGDKTFMRFASHAEAFTVTQRHSRVEAGRSLVISNSRNHCLAESSATSVPNRSVTARKNAVSSRSAKFIDPVQSGFFVSCFVAL